MQCSGALVTSRSRGLFHVIVETRLLQLCEEHADEVCRKRLLSLADLHAAFLEPFPGQRSLVPRRARETRAIAAAQAPRGPGRRAREAWDS